MCNMWSCVFRFVTFRIIMKNLDFCLEISLKNYWNFSRLVCGNPGVGFNSNSNSGVGIGVETSRVGVDIQETCRSWSCVDAHNKATRLAVALRHICICICMVLSRLPNGVWRWGGDISHQKIASVMTGSGFFFKKKKENDIVNRNKWWINENYTDDRLINHNKSLK